MTAPELGGKEFWDRLLEDPALLASEVCTIDLVDLDATLQMHASLTAWVNAAHEAARIKEEKLKWDVTVAEAEALLGHKRTMDEQTGKWKTVAVLNAEVTVDPLVIGAMNDLFAQQEIRGALRAMSKALEDRCQMLMQLAAKQRKEQDTY